MRKFYWMLGLAVAGLFLAMKDVDWLYDSNAHKVGIFAQYGAVGALIGLCLSVATVPAPDRRNRLKRFVCWVFAFALLGLALGHGNVPWLVTLRVMAEAAAIGAVVGALQYVLSRRPSNERK